MDSLGPSGAPLPTACNCKPLRGYKRPRFIKPASYATCRVCISHTSHVIISSKSNKYTHNAPLQHNTWANLSERQWGEQDIRKNGIKKYISKVLGMQWLTATEMVCLSPSFVSWVVKCHFVSFFYNNGMGRKGVVITLRCFHISEVVLFSNT